jgi:colanic acid/amylovoran biosynthesis glycosyltransferase
VLSTRHSGIPELVEHGVSGLLVPERDSEALADHLADLMDHPERWPAMGRAGRARVEAAFDSDRLTEELVTLYHRVISGIESAQRI